MSIGEVINRIQAQIPADCSWASLELQQNAAQLSASLSQIKTQVEHTSPQEMYKRWLELDDLLSSYLVYPPETAWQEKVLAIGQGKR